MGILRWSLRADGDVPGPSDFCDGSTQSSDLHQSPGLQHPLLLTPPASRVHKPCLLGPLPHLSPLVLQPVHSLPPPLRSHGAGVPRKMALRPRAKLSFMPMPLPPTPPKMYRGVT
uniref:Uncharacterized protein n=1 Tax=Peromyscus maniculatus bairdii TaxID=230844 RepID=A0A8C8UCQ3_PERMB